MISDTITEDITAIGPVGADTTAVGAADTADFPAAAALAVTVVASAVAAAMAAEDFPAVAAAADKSKQIIFIQR